MYQIWKTVMMIIIQQKFEKNKKLTLKPDLTKYNNACLVTNNACLVTNNALPVTSIALLYRLSSRRMC